MGVGDRVKGPALPAGTGGEAGELDVPGAEAGLEDGRWWEPWVAGTLLGLTLVSTLTAGALLQGVDPLGVRSGVVDGVPLWWPTRLDLPALLSGASYALPLVAILLAHEWAHRLAAGRHGIRTSYPYLLPFPPHASVVGTLGGFIRLRSAVPSRKALLDVAIAGPVTSLLLAIATLTVGLMLSGPSQLPRVEGLPFVIVFQEIPIRLGEPLLLRGLVALLPVDPGGAALELHPAAFAGWLGLMLTFLNLLPLARLDGGHILHALHPGRQRWWARATVGVFLLLGFLWAGWWAWAAVMFLLGRSRPLPADMVGREPTPGPWRRRMAWSLMAALVLLVPPVPVGF